MSQYKTDREIAQMVKAAIGSKTQKSWADAAGISTAYLSDFLAGRRGAGPAILKAIGYEPEPYYRKGAAKK